MKKVKEGIRKYLKGMLGIFVLKVMLLGVFLIHQACETDGTPNLELQLQAKENYLKVLKNTSEKISSIQVKKMGNEDMISYRNSLSGSLEVSEEGTIICSDEEVVPSKEDPTTENSLIVADFIGVVLNSKEDFIQNGGEEQYCYHFVNSEVEETFEPATNAAKEYFYAQGLTDDDITEMLDGNNENVSNSVC